MIDEGSGAMNDDSYCDVTERLFAEFEQVHPLPVIAGVVRRCRQDLDGNAPREALPEMLERLARQRLSDLPSRARQEQNQSASLVCRWVKNCS